MQSYYEHVSKRCREAESISISKSTLTPGSDTGVAFVPAVKQIISNKDREGSMPVSAQASTVYAV